MSHKYLRRLPLAVAAMVVCMSAQAEYTFVDGKLHLSGFGTVGDARATSDEALFNYPGQGGGADKRASLSPDTKLGLQGTYQVTNTVSATAQLLTKYRASGEYTPEFEWAFAKWQGTPNLTVRIGRMVAPFFMVSDFRDVGYANTTLRPTLDVYGQVPVSSVDGGDISYQTNVGSATLTSGLWAGQTKAKYAAALQSQGAPADPNDFKLRNQYGMNFQVDFDGGYTLRLGHSHGKLSVRSTAVNNYVASLSPLLKAGGKPKALAQTAVDALTTDSTDSTFDGVGFSMDQGNIVMASEYTWRRAKQGILSDTTGWYVMGGYRFGAWLPYLVISRIKTDELNGTVDPALAKVAGGGARAYATAIAIQQFGLVTKNTVSIGTRWDFSNGMDLKFQFDHTSKPTSSNGLFLIPDPSSASGQDFFKKQKKVNVLSLALDFVF
jgi:hypothetical protein